MPRFPGVTLRSALQHNNVIYMYSNLTNITAIRPFRNTCMCLCHRNEEKTRPCRTRGLARTLGTDYTRCVRTSCVRRSGGICHCSGSPTCTVSSPTSARQTDCLNTPDQRHYTLQSSNTAACLKYKHNNETTGTYKTRIAY